MTLDILMFLICLHYLMRLSANFQVVFWTCFWSFSLFVFQSHKTFHVEDAMRTQHMLCKKQSAIIIINNKQSNLLSKTWLRLRPVLKKSTPAPLLFSKIVKTQAGVYSDTPAPVHLWHVSVAEMFALKFFRVRLQSWSKRQESWSESCLQHKYEIRILKNPVNIFD